MTALNLEAGKPFAKAELGSVKIVVWSFVYRLQKGAVNGDRSARL